MRPSAKRSLFPSPAGSAAAAGRRKRPDHRLGALLNFGHSALSDDVTTARTGFGAHLDDPIGLGQHLGVVIHQYHRVTVLDQIVHDAGQSHDVGRVQADGRLVQHVEHAGGAVAGPRGPAACADAHRWRGWTRRGQGEVIQPQFIRRRAAVRKDSQMLSAMGAHFRGQAGGHAGHPLGQLGQRHRCRHRPARYPADGVRGRPRTDGYRGRPGRSPA